MDHKPDSRPEGHAEVCARIRSKEWWLMPVASPDAAEMADKILKELLPEDRKNVVKIAIFEPGMEPFLLMQIERAKLTPEVLMRAFPKLETHEVQNKSVIFSKGTPIAVMLWAFALIGTATGTLSEPTPAFPLEHVN